jgi:hypothetical protein
MTRPVLFRGDSLDQRGLSVCGPHRGRTFVQHAISDGLIARFADGGRSHYTTGTDEVDLVLAHVGYDRGHPEADLAYHSPLISFATEESTAWRFANRSGKALQPCRPEEATHFLWRFEPDLEEFRGRTLPGIYEFQYSESHANVRRHLNDALERGLAESAAGGSLPCAALAAWLVGGAVVGQHAALVIHVPTLVNSWLVEGKDRRLVANARMRGERDDEWLVYPCDALPEGGTDARLKMNAHLFLHDCRKLA